MLNVPSRPIHDASQRATHQQGAVHSASLRPVLPRKPWCSCQRMPSFPRHGVSAGVPGSGGHQSHGFGHVDPGRDAIVMIIISSPAPASSLRLLGLFNLSQSNGDLQLANGKWQMTQNTCHQATKTPPVGRSTLCFFTTSTVHDHDALFHGCA